MNPAHSIRVLVLDFDGVIIESNDAKTEAFRDLFSGFPDHLDAMMEFHHGHVSASRFVKFRHLVVERLGQSDDEPSVMKLAVDYSHLLRHRIDRCPLVPGARELLDEWFGQVPLFLASVTPQPELIEILERRDLRRYFDAVFGDPPVPKVRAVAQVLKQTGAEPANVVLIGDTPGDQRVAQATGVTFIGRDSGIPFPDPAPLLHRDLFEVAGTLRTRRPSSATGLG